MRSSQYDEDVILNLLKEAAAGIPIGQVCSTARISTRTFYRWRAQYGGLTPAAARDRNDLLHENARLRALLQDLGRRRDGPERSNLSGAAASFRSEMGTRPAAAVNVRGHYSSGRFASVRGRL